MLKVFFFVAVAALNMIVSAPAQYGGDPYSSYIDQMVRDNINLRRSTDARRASSKKSSKIKTKSRTSKSRLSRSASSKRVQLAAKSPVLGQLSLGQDMYSSFGDADPRDFTLEVRLIPVRRSDKAISDKAIVRWARFAPSKGNRSARVNGIPVGFYKVSVKVIDDDKKTIPTLIGTQCGEPTNPNGGNFAPTQPIDLAMGKDYYGNRAIIQKTTLWFRPHEATTPVR